MFQSLFLQAIDTLKTFERKDSKMVSQAAVNLSFLYFLVSKHMNNLWTGYTTTALKLEEENARKSV